jgi:hypothetical protein
MTKNARAAELWARLEKRLIERCGLPNGHMLDVNRPYLIRWIGDRLKATPVDVGRAAAVENVSPPLPVKRETVEMLTFKSTRDDTIHNAKLAAMLEKSCSRRTGYDGDDTVSYERG